MNKKLLGRLIVSLLLLYSITLIVQISVNSENCQWDFLTHMQAGKIFAAGENPYNPNILFPRVRHDVLYVYPPITLFFYRLFSLMDENVAFHLFLFLKCLALGGIIYLWRKEFLKEKADIYFYPFALLAFNGAIYLDMLSGNINMLEQFLLWIAFFFYLKRRWLLFCILILIAASFKIMPILFLFLLWISEDKKKHIYFFGSIILFLVYLFTQYMIFPRLFTAFVNNGANTVLAYWGIVVPSTSIFIEHLFRLLTNKTDITTASWLVRGMFISTIFAVNITIFFFTQRAYIASKFLKIEDKRKLILFLTCLTYALIHPRFADYNYTLLIVPTYFIMKRINYIKIYLFLFMFTVLSARHITLPGLKVVFFFFWEYYPLFVAYCIWGLYLQEIFVLTKKPMAKNSCNG